MFQVGCVNIPISLAQSIGQPRNSLNGCLGGLAILRVVHCTSLLSYLLVTLDRFWAIMYPYSYVRNMKSKLAMGRILISATMLPYIWVYRTWLIYERHNFNVHLWVRIRDFHLGFFHWIGLNCPIWIL